jgi:hypothetical protein
MTTKQIRDLYQATPFRPFRLHMANGRSLDVPHLDFMLLSASGRQVVISTLRDTFEIVDVLLVTGVETLPKNGTARRGRRGKSKS